MTDHRLTPAQKSAVRDGYIGDQQMRTVRTLKRLGYFHAVDNPGTTCYHFELTEKGHALHETLNRTQPRRANTP